MFMKLRKKIIRYVLLTTILFALVIGIISFIILSRNIYTNFKDSSHLNISQSIQNSTFSIEAAKSSTIQISQNENIRGSLNSSYDSSISPILSVIKNTSYGVGGVTLYTTSGIIYSTDSISGIPTLETMKQNEGINSFIESNETSYLSIRTTQIANIYNHYRYDPQYGMVSYIVKLYDNNNQVGGYLFVDIKPSYLYSQFFSYEDYKNFYNTETYIMTDDNTYLKSDQNSDKHNQYLVPQTNKTKISDDNKFLIISRPFYQDDYKIITLIPMELYYTDIITIAGILIFIIILLAVFSYYIAIALTNNMVSSLAHLHRKMKDTDLNKNTE